MGNISTSVLIITLNVNYLKASIKNRWVGWIKKYYATICCQHETYFKYNSLGKLKEWKRIYHTNINRKKTRVTILIPDNMNFKAKKITREREREKNYIMNNGSIHEKTPAILNVY